MEAWTCPECGRLFAKRRQGHDCAPALTLEEYFSTGPAHERPIVDAVLAALDAAGVGPLHVEPVSVGIFLKNPAKVAELRPRDRWVAVSFSLDRRASHPTIRRKVVAYGRRFFHVANVASPADLDEALVALLVEACESARP